MATRTYDIKKKFKKKEGKRQEEGEKKKFTVCSSSSRVLNKCIFIILSWTFL